MQSDVVIKKIVEEVNHIKTATVEPGVEMVRGLSTIIDTTIRDSVRSGEDLSVIAQGILIGAFRCRSIKMEARKTIRLLIREIVQTVLKNHGDVKHAIDGILSGIDLIAREHKLNVQEALIIANESLKEMVDQVRLD